MACPLDVYVLGHKDSGTTPDGYEICLWEMYVSTEQFVGVPLPQCSPKFATQSKSHARQRWQHESSRYLFKQNIAVYHYRAFPLL
jgi:hypothetical protein